MPEIEATIDVSLECESCGATLMATCRGVTIRVAPCENCLTDKYNEGIKDGAVGAAREIEEARGE